MSKTVETLSPYIPASAANIEDMTQPMGPLEEGDQAIVDALHRLPDHTGMDVVPTTKLMARDADGAVTHLTKDGTYKQEMAAVHTMRPDGSSESVSTLVNPIPGMETIRVTKREASAEAGSHSEYVSGNKVAERAGEEGETDRARAQAIKLKVAEKIDAATRRMSEEQIQDPVLARDMADAEAPYRENIAQRKQKVAAAKSAADILFRNHVDRVGDVTQEDLRQAQAHETTVRDAVAQANREDMDSAQAAAEAARQQYEKAA